MFRTTAELIGWSIIAVALLALACTLARADQSVYTRSEATYTIRWGGTAYNVADRLGSWSRQERWLIAQEIAALNGVRAGRRLEQGHELTVPVYRRTGAYLSGDIRNWHLAVVYGRKHGVSPALMMAVRTHENPSPRREGYGYGVVAVKWTSLRKQAEWGARIIARIARQQGWSPMQPTRAGVMALGRAYAEGSEHWGRCVWVHYCRAKGR